MQAGQDGVDTLRTGEVPKATQGLEGHAQQATGSLGSFERNALWCLVTSAQGKASVS